VAGAAGFEIKGKKEENEEQMFCNREKGAGDGSFASMPFYFFTFNGPKARPTTAEDAHG
jgi:hypothetical protein